jgi:hypothetical protein
MKYRNNGNETYIKSRELENKNSQLQQELWKMRSLIEEKDYFIQQYEIRLNDFMNISQSKGTS